MAGARSQPDASANCASDQPISTCQLTPEQQLYTVTLDCAQSAASTVGMANPASVNCVQQGGTLAIEERGDGGQYGICIEDNRQCEEWALCVAIAPPAASRSQAMSRPRPAIAPSPVGICHHRRSGAEDEQGTCTFKDGGQCDAWDYYNGKCVPSSRGAKEVRHVH